MPIFGLGSGPKSPNPDQDPIKRSREAIWRNGKGKEGKEV
jgi:hypothetical protein